MNIIIKLLICFLGNLIVFGLLPANAGSIEPELVELISTQRNNTNIDVIIKFTDKLDISKTSGLGKHKLIRKLKNKLDNKQISVNSLFKFNRIKTKNLWLSNSIAATIPSSLIPAIASQKNVLTVIIDKKITLDSTGQGSPPLQPNWNMTTIGANTVWGNGITGAGIIIGSMDTGVDIDHPDLSASWRGGNNSWFDPYGFYTTPHDSNGHGTQTTSIITGGNSSGNYLGVAPSAKWIAAKIFDDTNTASLSAIHLAFQWMLDPDGNPETDDGADIINNSWNFGTIAGQCDYEFQDDISILRSADIAVVFSAGNSGPSPETSHSPANNKDTIPIGAVDESLNTAFFSSQGPSACDDGAIYPKLLAPGVNIMTADLTFGGIILNSYIYSSGTSYSAPHISGALALLQSKHPSSSLSEREEALYNTATIKETIDNSIRIINIDTAMKYMGRAQLISPNSNNPSEDATPSFTWSNVADAVMYRLLVVTPSSSRIIDSVIPVNLNTCINESKICSVTPSTIVSNGSYWWSVQAKTPYGWESWAKFIPFSVGTGSTPDSPNLTLPAINSSGVNATPLFTWNAESSATDYKLLVVDLSGAHSIDETISVATTNCSSGIGVCSISSTATSLSSGSYWWSIKAKNSYGWGAWSTFRNFSVGSVPTSPSLVSPIGTSSSTPTYTWDQVTTATKYRLLVVGSTSFRFIDETNTASTLGCSTSTGDCSITPTVPTNMPPGNYWWGIQAKNSFGWSSWSSFEQFQLP